MISPDLDRRVHGIERRLDDPVKGLNAIQGRFDGIGARFDGIDARFDGIDARFHGIDARFDGIDARFDGIDARFDLMDARFYANDVRVGSIDLRLQRVEGKVEEFAFNQRPHSYFGVLAKRVRSLPIDELEDVFEALQDRGQLTSAERIAVLSTDGIFHGRIDGQPIILVVETSLTIDGHDVQRAKERAAILARGDTPCIPVVAGGGITGPARALADAQDVRVVIANPS